MVELAYYPWMRRSDSISDTSGIEDSPTSQMSKSPDPRPRPLRIALVYPGCSTLGGVERVVWEAARFLSKHNEVTVVAREVNDLPAGVEFRPVREDDRLDGIGPLRPLAFRRSARRALEGLHRDVTVVYGSECPAGDVYVIGSVHKAWLRKAGPATIRGITVSGRFRYISPNNLVILWLERSLLANAAGRTLVPCSDVVTTDLASLYGLRHNPVTVVNNGFSPEQFSPERRSTLRVTSRSDLGYGEDDVVMLMAANEWQRKGLPVLLEAMRLLNQPSLHLLLVGRINPDHHLTGIEDSVLASHVRYLGASRDVAVQHAVADLFVMPTQYEAFSLAIVEALASGLPVITTTVPGAGDTIIEDVNGLLLSDPTSAEELAALLKRGLDPGTRRRWSDAAPSTVSQYSWDGLMGKFEQVIRGIAEGTSGSM